MSPLPILLTMWSNRNILICACHFVKPWSSPSLISVCYWPCYGFFENVEAGVGLLSRKIGFSSHIKQLSTSKAFSKVYQMAPPCEEAVCIRFCHHSLVCRCCYRRSVYINVLWKVEPYFCLLGLFIVVFFVDKVCDFCSGVQILAHSH